MSFPSVSIAQPIIYYSRVQSGINGGPFAALITAVDNTNSKIDLVYFPPGQLQKVVTGIRYGDDVLPNDGFFLLTSDAAPSCGDEVLGASVTNTDTAAFIVEWTRPASSSSVIVKYKVTGGPTWLTPNAPGNKLADIDPALELITFLNLDDSISYDILIQNICNNGEVSAGVIVTDTAITPP
jgi:hypothetical protein